MVVAALEVAPIVPMANTNIPTLAVSVHIVAQVLLGAVLIVRLESISMNLGKVNVVIADPVLTVVVRIVHQVNMNIKKMGKVAPLISSDRNKKQINHG